MEISFTNGKLYLHTMKQIRRLCQGVMFLMELSVLASSDHEIRIMDGTHFTPLLKINSLLSANEDSVGPQYTEALREFLNTTQKINSGYSRYCKFSPGRRKNYIYCKI